jgi:hypothetical protein
MDAIGLITLRAEIDADLMVVSQTIEMMKERLSIATAVNQEAAAFQMVRLYNVIEQMGLRIAKAFENHIDDEQGWHSQLIKRLSLDIPGIRPRFYCVEDLVPLQDLRGFRHVVVHAYDLVIQGDRLMLVAAAAEKIASMLPVRVATFFQVVGQGES